MDKLKELENLRLDALSQYKDVQLSRKKLKFILKPIYRGITKIFLDEFIDKSIDSKNPLECIHDLYSCKVFRTREDTTLADDELYDIDKVIKYHIFKSTKGCYLNQEELDDLYQCAYMGYLKAKKNKRADTKLYLSYASMYIRSEILLYIDKLFAYKRQHIHVDDFDSWDSGTIENSSVIKCFKHATKQIRQNRQYKKYMTEDSKKIKNLIETTKELTLREKSILMGSYFYENPLTLRELAKPLNISIQRVQQIRSAAIEKLKRIMEDI